ncbi:ESPR domain-containing protein, partial [Glaesserella parasuis]|nr:ESPR domain-containing protein [Glaesserella parasuis]
MHPENVNKGLRCFIRKNSREGYFIMNKIFRVIWSHAQQAWVVVSELVKSHTKTSACTDKRAQVCTSDYFLDKQQDKFKLSLLSLVLLGIFFS